MPNSLTPLGSVAAQVVVARALKRTAEDRPASFRAPSKCRATSESKRTPPEVTMTALDPMRAMYSPGLDSRFENDWKTRGIGDRHRDGGGDDLGSNWKTNSHLEAKP